MSEPRTIKKYPNRRLYDPGEGRYITLKDIHRMVIEGVDFVVVEKSTQEDITRSILLQVIAAQEEHGRDSLLSRDFLLEIIRCHKGVARRMIASYLEQSLNLYGDARAARSSARGDASAAAPVSLAEANYRRWCSVQDEIYRKLMNAGRSGSGPVEETRKVTPGGQSGRN